MQDSSEMPNPNQLQPNELKARFKTARTPGSQLVQTAMKRESAQYTPFIKSDEFKEHFSILSDTPRDAITENDIREAHRASLEVAIESAIQVSELKSYRQGNKLRDSAKSLRELREKLVDGDEYVESAIQYDKATVLTAIRKSLQKRNIEERAQRKINTIPEHALVQWVEETQKDALIKLDKFTDTVEKLNAPFPPPKR